MRVSPITYLTIGLSACLTPTRAAAESDPISDAINRGVDALFAHLNPHDVIQYRSGQTPREVQGRVVKTTNDLVTIETTDGTKLTIPRTSIITWKNRGLVREEMDSPYRTGPSTLAALALVNAQVAASHPRLEPLLSVLEQGPGDGAGTYVYSLRASLWSALLDRPLSAAQKARYRKLLKQDVNWLTRAARSNGWYGYTSLGADGDHSNTQFANLGLWAGSIGKIEIAKQHWRTMAKHWMEQQNADGGWSYNEVGRYSSASMTLAGCNSLYIALDRHYALPETSYRLFEGINRTKPQREQVALIQAAIEKGDQFLASHPPDPDQSQGYELFGLERLGLASGRAVIGGRDWFRQHARRGTTRTWGDDVITDSFWLIYLVHGHAPVLFQKLEHGPNWEAWGYYPRDLDSLTRYMNRAFERLHRWQRIPHTATLREMQDAPFLYVAGQETLQLTEACRATIRQYVEQGGTLILHANRASKDFTSSAVETFETLFKDWGVQFTQVADDHPLRHCYFGGKGSEWKRPIPLRILCDGRRPLAILIPVDIAGAWQQDRAAYEDLFRIMVNIRVFAAPPFAELPRVMRSETRRSAPAPIRTSLRVARKQPSDGPLIHPQAWMKLRDLVRDRANVEVRLINAAEDWRQANLVHLTINKPDRVDAQLVRDLMDYMTHGGVVLLDAVDGQPDTVAAILHWVEALDVGQRQMLGAEHPIVRGVGTTSEPLLPLETTDAGLSLGRSGAIPPIITRTIEGRTTLVACPFDVTAGMDGCFVWGRIGYRTESTRRLMESIVLWRAEETSKSRGR